MSSVAAGNNSSTEAGKNVMLAGLIFQVVTLVIFMLLAADFTFRTVRHPRGLDQDPVLVRLRASWRFRLFLAALCLSTLTIFIRCVFRVAELSDGWSGPLMARQDLFIGFEGAMIIVAVGVLNIFHPNLCFPEMQRFNVKKSPKERGNELGSYSGMSSEGVSKAPSIAP